MAKTPDWPFRCPKEGWYLSKVEAIFPADIGLSHEDCNCDQLLPLVVYGECKQHGRVWLSDPAAYTATLWKKES